jgi:hypothetical protein
MSSGEVLGHALLIGESLATVPADELSSVHLELMVYPICPSNKHLVWGLAVREGAGIGP